MSSVYLITGIQAAGKSTVAQALAERFDRSVHVRGDLFRRMVVNGAVGMTPDLPAEAVRQLRLRYALAAMVADRYAEAGFTVVAQDIIIGEELTEMTVLIRHRPLYLIVLAPHPATVAAREARRTRTGYGEWTVEELDLALRQDTPRIGLWLDTSAQTPEQTVVEILRRAPAEAAVP